MAEHVPPSTFWAKDAAPQQIRSGHTFWPREPQLGKCCGLAEQRIGPASDLRESRGLRESLALPPLHRHHNLADLFIRLHVSMGLDNLIKLEGLRDDGFKYTAG